MTRTGAAPCAAASVIHAELRRVDVDHPPEHRTREHLPQRLGGVEPVARRERDPPGGNLLRAQLADGSVAEDGHRLTQQPAQLLDRHCVNVVLLEVRLYQFGERQGSRDSLLPSQELQLSLQSLRRVPLGESVATASSLHGAVTAIDAKPMLLSSLMTSLRSLALC
jgi:hypothetical protein